MLYCVSSRFTNIFDAFFPSVAFFLLLSSSFVGSLFVVLCSFRDFLFAYFLFYGYLFSVLFACDPDLISWAKTDFNGNVGCFCVLQWTVCFCVNNPYTYQEHGCIFLSQSRQYSHVVLDVDSSVQFSSVQDGIYAFGKALIFMRSTPSLQSFPVVAFETTNNGK